MRVELHRKIFVTACREKFHAALPLFGTNDLYRDHAGKAWVRILGDHRESHTGHEKSLFCIKGLKTAVFHARHENSCFSCPA